MSEKPSIENFMYEKIRSIRSGFDIPMRVTIIVREPANPELEVMFTDDDIDGLIEVMQRRRDAILASQRSIEDPGETE